jgi:hypothetical protein
MKAMIWKEAREHFLWAILAALGLTIMTVTSLATISSDMQGSMRPPQMGHLFESLPIIAPLFAGVLGLLQILPELRRDQWAFLIHRPASRTQLFFGKAAAGLGLYFLAMGLPCLGALLWLATPGNVAAPFSWNMSLPLVADILSGLVFYFAAMLVALRPARWYGSRALPLGAAVICAFANQAANNLGQAMALLLPSIIILGFAAWGSFLTTGIYGPQPKVAKWGLGISLYAGLVLVCGGAIAVVFSWLETHISIEPMRWTDYRVDKAGRVLRVTWEDSMPQSASDLTGKPMALPKSRTAYAHDTFVSFSDVPLKFQGNQGRSYRDNPQVIPLAGAEKNVWYYLPFERQAIGYAKDTKRIVGYIGPQGFSATPLPMAKRFPAAPVSNLTDYTNPFSVLAFRSAIYRFDPFAGSVTAMAQAQPGEQVRGANQIWFNTGTSRESRTATVVTIGNRMEIFSSEGKRLFTTLLALSSEEYPWVSIGVTPGDGRYFLWHHPRRDKGNAAKASALLQEIAVQGSETRVVKTHTLPPLLRPHSDQWTAYAIAPVVPPGLLAGLSGYAAVGNALRIESAQTLWHDMFVSPAPELPIVAFFTLSAFAGLLAALGAHRIAKQRAMTPRAVWLWSFAVFWLGIFGLLLLIALEAWPARETCPSCHHKRVVTRELCEHCAAPFALPSRDGTEIFA